MKLKITATTISLVLLVTLGLFSWEFFERTVDVIRTAKFEWWVAIVCSVIILVAGHWLRMLRTKTVTDFASIGRAREQFGALAIGYLFNTVLPLRIGELIRAGIIAFRLRISFLYTLTVVLVERVVDLLLIGCFVIVASFFFNGRVASSLFIVAIGAILVSVAILVSLVLLVREDRRLLNILWRVTGWFNTGVCNNMRFKIWSLIFGLQQFIGNKKALRRYVLLTFASWGSYIVAMSILASALLSQLGIAQTFVAASSPYIAVSAPSGPAYINTYEEVMLPVVAAADKSNINRQRYIILSWLVLTVPMCAIGLVALLFTKFKIEKRTKQTTFEGFANKLMRKEDISQEFPAFLDSYFQGSDLSHILHKLELSGDISLVKFFKGGSDAITVLVLADERLFVKKIIPLKHEDRLMAQYDWLLKHDDLPHLVEVIGEQRSDSYYAIDLAYNEENVSFFEFAHQHTLRDAEKVLGEVWGSIHKSLHMNARKLQTYPNKRAQFIEKHIFGCIEKAVSESNELRRALEYDRITINGREYDNLYQIMEKIRNHKQAWKDIASYQDSGVVHGDPSIDNILVDPYTHEPLIIDPAPDGNIINGPVFDMGKMMQSFYCGYEFLFRDESPVHLNEDGSINYRDHRSERYVQLCQFVQNGLAPRFLEESEQRALVFHAAALHIRRLKHQTHYCPANSLKFYAVGVKALNEFLGQYK